MTKNHQALDILEAAKPGAESLDRGVIDLAVEGKGCNRCWNETSEIKGFHV
jgi:hypothetical protein